MEEKKVKVFLSIPMKGRTIENFMYTVERTKEIVKPIINKNHDITNFVFVTGNMTSDDKGTISDNERVRYLGESISRMAECDYVVLLRNTTGFHRGCWAERHIAEDYGFKIIEIEATYVYSDEEIQAIRERSIDDKQCYGTVRGE